MRHRHLMRRTTGDAQPKQIASLAIETVTKVVPGESRRKRLTLNSWACVGCSGAKGVYGKDVEATGKDADSFWDAVKRRLRKGGTMWLFCHRAADMLAIMGAWEMIDDGRLRISGADSRSNRDGASKAKSARKGYAVLEDPPFVLDLRYDSCGGLLRILDIANYGIGEESKGEIPIGISRSTQRFVRQMIEILATEGLGSLQATAASQSLYSYRRKHLGALVQCHDHGKALLLERGGYYGGRCECFRVGRLPKTVYHLDVSSMYPSIYTTSILPVGLSGFSERLDSGLVADCLSGNICIADCVVQTDRPLYPLRDERKNITVWPVGRFATVLADAELRAAVARKHLVAVNAIAWYQGAPFLASFGEAIKRLRQGHKGNKPIQRWLKALGVCLVGKLGQQDRRWIDSQSPFLTPMWGTWEQQDENEQWVRWRSFAGITQREEKGGFSYDAVPAAAACITSLGRMKLLEFIECAGWQNVHYIDTDALFTNAAGFCRLAAAGHLSQTEWGKLKLEGVYHDVRVNGIKDYELEGKHVCAGLAKEKYGGVADANGQHKRIRMQGYMAGRVKPDSIVVSVPHERHVRYRHGVVAEDGTVTPFMIGVESVNRPFQD